ncbi:MFS transporter [Microvirga tunisiensis]|uniref:MFS transporter n=1 Tax=Pannonibacter tanglangensis TaxID=2750084 RepID=A0A7X5F0E7_9HYPH|nr:MFS transporter [Pannonibacter sp. XCT-53]NBN77493.1 MFS transporter [Pannonibacter sp. XCT-53]
MTTGSRAAGSQPAEEPTSTPTGSPGDPLPPSPWSPFRSTAFAVIWTAVLVSNAGLWMRDVASGWLMTGLAASPLMVALVQAALLVPVFLFALPAGALADLVDRRRLLIAVQSGLAVLSLIMAGLVAAEMMTPALLLACTFAAGTGAALAAPAFQSIVPALVPKRDLRAALALNSMGINIARALGPALGGLVLATAGVALAYALDALSTLVAVAAFLWWRPPPPTSTRQPERFVPAMIAGLGYVLRAPAMHRVVLRAAAFFFCASAYWALLPLLARDVLQVEAAIYGLMLAAVGAGAVAGAVLLPRLARQLSASHLVLAGSLLTAVAMAGLTLVPHPGLALAWLALAGLAWITVLTQLNVAAQTSLADWVRARGLAVYLMVFYGAMAGGSAVWGQIAGVAGVDAALLSAAGLLALSALVVARVLLPDGSADLTPSRHWPQPVTAGTPDPAAGPVLVTLTWQVAADKRDEFLAAAHAFAQRRRRDGAFGWQIWEDVARPGQHVEAFLASTWADHLRQHERMTQEDAAAQANLVALAEAPPEVRHHLASRQQTEAGTACG